MLRLRAAIIAATVVFAGGCDERPRSDTLDFGLGSVTNNPVYVLEYSAEGLHYPLLPTFAPSGADGYPRSGNKIWLRRQSPSDLIEVNVAWLEVLTQRAYAFTTTIREEDITLRGTDLEISVLLLPGGEFKIISDPLPIVGAKQQRIRDLVRGCAQRRPDLDRDITGEVDAIPTLRDRIAFATNPIDAPPCGGGS